MRTLLIADDESGVRALVRMTLESGEYDIVEASNGNDALRLAQESAPDLMFLDVMMPGLSGVEVCKTLKSDPTTSGIRIVLLTAKAQDADREEGLAAGADDYFTKPFSPLSLIGKVDEVLHQAAS